MEQVTHLGSVILVLLNIFPKKSRVPSERLIFILLLIYFS